GRQAMQIRIKTLDEWNLGMLVALFERAVAAYAELIGVNAFHQPGVEAYKKASDQIMSDLVEIRQKLEKVRNWQGTLLELSDLIRFSGGASILEDILTKFIENTGTEVYGEKRISRQLDNAENWIYKII
nr:hypothetical protein [FCB group bacterium]